MRKNKTDRVAEAVFLIFISIVMVTLAVHEAFGMMPDEFSHFEVVYYIYRHGTIPTGYEASIQVPYWGASYAFQPILTYIIQGFLMRLVDVFTDNIFAIILSARLVDCAFGVIMAYFVRRISVILWDDRSLQWLFTFIIVLLPENLYIHSYINTDSMALMSVAIIIYALLRGEEDDFSVRTMVTLAIGVSFCLLSYYNAYGAVLIAVIWFFSHFIFRSREQGDAHGYRRVMWKKFGFTALLVCIMAGWWFVRSGILYNGDIFGLHARWELAVKEAEPQYSPLTKQTFAGQGISLKDMLLSNDYLKTVYRSFICVMGNFDISTADIFYRIDKVLIIIAAVCAVIPVRPTRHFIKGAPAAENRHTYIDIFLISDILITLFLHMIYSYAYDWQPQGRYLLPMLIPLMYLMTLGADKAGVLAVRLAAHAGRYAEKAGRTAVIAVRLIIMAYVVYVLIYTLKVCVIPLYFGDADFMSYAGRTWQQVIPEFMMK